MAQSTKQELHNVLQCPQGRIEPRPQVICTENFVKFWSFEHVVLEICEQTDRDRQTYRHAHCNTSHLYRGELTTATTRQS